MRKVAAHIVLILLLVLAGTEIARAQNERDIARLGNKALEAGNYEEAIEHFDRALKKNPDRPGIKYNRALAQYKSEQYEEAAEKFNEVTLSTDDKKLKSKAFHNMGNSFLQQEKWQEGADAFKKALMNNPADEDSRYNLSYALKKIQEQEDPEDEENEDEENEDEESEDDDSEDDDENDDGDEDEDGSDQDDDEEGEDENDGDDNDDDGEEDQDDEEGSDQDEDNDEDQNEQQQPDQLSQEDVDRILDALLNEERQIQEGLKKEKGQPVKGRQIEKEW